MAGFLEMSSFHLEYVLKTNLFPDSMSNLTTPHIHTAQRAHGMP